MQQRSVWPFALAAVGGVIVALGGFLVVAARHWTSRTYGFDLLGIGVGALATGWWQQGRATRLQLVGSLTLFAALVSIHGERCDTDRWISCAISVFVATHLVAPGIRRRVFAFAGASAGATWIAGASLLQTACVALIVVGISLWCELPLLEAATPERLNARPR